MQIRHAFKHLLRQEGGFRLAENASFGDSAARIALREALAREKVAALLSSVLVSAELLWAV
jgi:hypothetical protein